MTSPADELVSTYTRQMELVRQFFDIGLQTAKWMPQTPRAGTLPWFQPVIPQWAPRKAAGEAQAFPWLGFYGQAMNQGAELWLVGMQSAWAMQAEAVRLAAASLMALQQNFLRSLEGASPSALGMPRRVQEVPRKPTP